MNKQSLPPLNFEQLSSNAESKGGSSGCSGSSNSRNVGDNSVGNGLGSGNGACVGNGSSNSAKDAIDLVSPRATRSPPQVSPRLTSFVDSPRPSEASVQRRLSQSNNKLKQSPLRYSLSETSFAHFVKPLKPLGTETNASKSHGDLKPNPRKIATCSGIPKSPSHSSKRRGQEDDAAPPESASSSKSSGGSSSSGSSSSSGGCGSSSSSSSSGGCGSEASAVAPPPSTLNVVALNAIAGNISAAEDSPPMGRLESHPAPLHLLEQVFHAPGGGIELRQVLGIYTSKRAAEHAARCYFDDNRESKQHFEHMRLVTSEVPVDKAASEEHVQRPVDLL